MKLQPKKNGDINFGKSANIGQDDANLVNFVSFQEGVTTEISIDIDAAVAKSTEIDNVGLTVGEPDPIMNFVRVKKGKVEYSGNGPSRSIFGPQNAHTRIKGGRDDNRVRCTTAGGESYGSDVSIASAKGKIEINHVGGANEASVTTSGIGGKFSNGEGRTNVNIKHNESNEE